MVDPNTLAKEMEKNGSMQAVKRLAASDEVAALAKRFDQETLRSAAEKQDPEVMKAVLQQLFATEEGRRLAQKVKAAMDHG